MVKGIQHVALSLIPRINRQAVVSNNLANLNTQGYKKDRLFIDILRNPGDSLAPDDEGLAMSERLITDFAQGPLERTGAPLDLALHGPGFFVLESAQGEALTRGGSFHLSGEGEIRTAAGEPLFGEDGPLKLPPGVTELSIGPTGQVSADGRLIDKLRIVDVEDPTQLRKRGGGTFEAVDIKLQPTRGAEIKQGFVEGSNAVGVQEMTEMMSLFRAYEAAQRAIQIQAQTVDTAINRVGRTGS